MKVLAIFIGVFVAIILIYGVSLLCALGQMDVASPKVPALASIVLAIFGFPFMDFWPQLGGDYMKQIIGDGGTTILFTLLDTSIWSAAITWVIAARFGKKSPA